MDRDIDEIVISFSFKFIQSLVWMNDHSVWSMLFTIVVSIILWFGISLRNENTWNININRDYKVSLNMFAKQDCIGKT